MINAIESIWHTVESENIVLLGYMVVRAEENALGRAATNNSCIIL